MSGSGRVDELAELDRLSQRVADEVESMEAVCALSAALTVRIGAVEAAPTIEHGLAAVLGAFGLGELARVPNGRDSRALETMLRGRIIEAYELSRDPGRSPGWTPTNRDVIQGEALSSEVLGAILRKEIVPLVPGLGCRLGARGAAFLEVGVGGAGLVISVCRQWSQLRAIGIDVWEPALRIAHERVAEAGLERRIELRRQNVVQLEDRDVYDLAWVPVNFLAADVLAIAVDRVRAAARPGGWIVLSVLYGETELSDALARLRVARSGGASLRPAEAVSLLESSGWEEIRSLRPELSRSQCLVVGRKRDQCQTTR